MSSYRSRLNSALKLVSFNLGQSGGQSSFLRSSSTYSSKVQQWKKNCDANPLIGLGCRRLHASSATFISVGASPDRKKCLDGKTLRLVSGSCYLPHPDQEDTGGEDAHFICNYEQAIGVADGISGWSEVSINAGLYAKELMSNSVNAIVKEPKGSIDPEKVLTEAHKNTIAKGSSTACIIALTNEGIKGISFGDSGFILIRDGSAVKRSLVQQHGFNFPFQLACGENCDYPSVGKKYLQPVIPGDVIVAGTKGLFDNLFDSDIVDIIVQAVKDGLEPQATAEKIAALARQQSMDIERTSPFSLGAKEAGFKYEGGKLDDVTVVVSYITTTALKWPTFFRLTIMSAVICAKFFAEGVL